MSPQLDLSSTNRHQQQLINNSNSHNNNNGASPCNEDSTSDMTSLEKGSKGSTEGDKIAGTTAGMVPGVGVGLGEGGGGGLVQLYRRQQCHSATRADRVAIAAKLHPPIDVLHKSKRILYAPTPSRELTAITLLFPWPDNIYLWSACHMSVCLYKEKEMVEKYTRTEL
jgi:hypothetical protein